MSLLVGGTRRCHSSQNDDVPNSCHGLSLMDTVFKCHNSATDEEARRHTASSRQYSSDSKMLRPDDKDARPYVLSHDDIITGIQDILLVPRRFPAIFREYSIAPPSGILLYGPSGTGALFVLLLVAPV
jgi:hypothetical protein